MPPTIPRLETPPSTSKSPYLLPQLTGELLSIPGSKGVFRVLASSAQTDGALSIFGSGSGLADAPGFHHHEEAHDVFLVTKGFQKLWVGERCLVMGPGDFASVPPGIIHNPEWLGPHTEGYGLVTPGDWLDFFRHISEPYSGPLIPEHDTRNLLQLLIPKIQAAAGKFDVVFHPHHQGCAVGEWMEEDERLPEGVEPYFLRANTGPRWVCGGVLCRPFITTTQSGGKFAIASLESSSMLSSGPLLRPLRFEKTLHVFVVQEGTLGVVVEGGEEVRVTEGETLFLPRGVGFEMRWRSRFVRVWSFSDGDGVETLVREAGVQWEGVLIPEKVLESDLGRFKDACENIGVVS
ncbi:cupin domain protein [Aulographum hederae CBS 113979]|uniref:Cupin domain protein n=1 Tax=Aulographum hederae CBS 113979 TaxID=1176131 RepID=A0A6G1GPI5_9PEZI|nr:cupin domain protein [Aulographum hederae CBS 113979]